MTSKYSYLAISLCFALLSCGSVSNREKTIDSTAQDSTTAIEPEIPTQPSYPQQSFAYYLQNLPTQQGVWYWNGEKKNDNLSVKLDVSEVQQCADAVIRLHAEWLWSQKRYEDIHYNFVSGFNADYPHYAEGYCIKVNGNTVNWVKTHQPDYSYETFREYLETVFQYANTASLEKELDPVTDTLQPGDVFIIGGFPGHAVIVTDVVPTANGFNFRCAQSWMPAQSIEYIQAFPSSRRQLPDKNKIANITQSEWKDFLNGDMYFDISGYEFHSKNLKRFKTTGVE